MVEDRQTSPFSYQYSPISPAVGREEPGEEEEVAMLDDVKSPIPVVASAAVQSKAQSTSTSNLPMQTKVYRRRWIMLAIFVLVFMTNAFQWIQFSIINNLITK